MSRPPSPVTKLSVAVCSTVVHVERQLVLALSVPLLSLAFRSSTFTSPLKVVATAVFAVLSATTASGNAVPATLV